jgi:hypothetical protein
MVFGMYFVQLRIASAGIHCVVFAEILVTGPRHRRVGDHSS